MQLEILVAEEITPFGSARVSPTAESATSFAAEAASSYRDLSEGRIVAIECGPTSPLSVGVSTSTAGAGADTFRTCKEGS
jgi:hypothetical protein